MLTLKPPIIEDEADRQDIVRVQIAHLWLDVFGGYMILTIMVCFLLFMTPTLWLMRNMSLYVALAPIAYLVPASLQYVIKTKAKIKELEASLLDKTNNAPSQT